MLILVFLLILWQRIERSMCVSDKVFRKKVERLYPEIAGKVTETPQFSDTGKVPYLFGVFSELFGISELDSEAKILFAGIILKLYDPDFISGFRKKVRDGLRPAVASIFGIEENAATWWFSNASARLRIYRDFAEAVESASTRILVNVGDV